jgi:hypothetical protein
METSTTKRKRPKSSGVPMECCADVECKSGRRNRFFVGKRMTPDSFRVEQSYEIERRRLLNRAIHGWGVVYGLPIELGSPLVCPGDGERRLGIGPGLALDPCGRELVQVEKVLLDLSDVLAIDQHGCLVPGWGRKCPPVDGTSPWTSAAEDCWLLSVHYAERLISPVALADPCQCDVHEWDQVCETVSYSLRRIPCPSCCPEPRCGLDCECATSACCPAEDAGTENGRTGPREALPPEGTSAEAECIPPLRRGGCRCLCDYLTALDPNPEVCGLCEVKKGLRVDLRNGVPLACVRLGRDNCDCWTFQSVFDDCGPRPLVKRNDLLFDLIRGCDLTRISLIGWGEWHRAQSSVPWTEFQESFRVDMGGGVIGSKYWVEFSKPVRRSTVHKDCFIVSIIALAEEGGWGKPLRVPIADVLTEHRPGDPSETIRRATVVFDQDWVKYELNVPKGVFNCDQVTVEIEICGDFILDCNSQAIDANAHGLSPNPTGNGVPGGTFRSTFPVGPRPRSGYPASDASDSSYMGDRP